MPDAGTDGHLFTEEHAALDGSRQVLLSEGGLNPESS